MLAHCVPDFGAVSYEASDLKNEKPPYFACGSFVHFALWVVCASVLRLLPLELVVSSGQFYPLS